MPKITGSILLKLLSLFSVFPIINHFSLFYSTSYIPHSCGTFLRLSLTNSITDFGKIGNTIFQTCCTLSITFWTKPVKKPLILPLIFSQIFSIFSQIGYLLCKYRQKEQYMPKIFFCIHCSSIAPYTFCILFFLHISQLPISCFCPAILFQIIAPVCFYVFLLPIQKTVKITFHHTLLLISFQTVLPAPPTLQIWSGLCPIPL